MKSIWMCVCGIYPTKSERKGYWRNGVTQFPTKTIYLRISWNILEYLTHIFGRILHSDSVEFTPEPPMMGPPPSPTMSNLRTAGRFTHAICHMPIKMVTWGLLGDGGSFFFNIRFCFKQHSCISSGELTYCNGKSHKITMFNGKIHYKWPCSIAMLVHQRVAALLCTPWPHCDHPRSSQIQISAIGGGQLVTAICFPLLAPRTHGLGEKSDHKYQRWWVDLGGYTKW